MSRLTALDPAQATGTTKNLLDGVQRSLGMTPNLMRTLAQAPAALEGYLSLNGALAKGTLSPQLREQLAITVAEANRCEYCLSAHTLLGKFAKLDGPALAAARQGESPDPKTQAALQFALAVLKQRGMVSDSALEAVLAVGYTQGEVAEIVAHVGLNVLTNYFNNVAQTEVDFPKVELFSDNTAERTSVRETLSRMLEMLKEGRMIEGQEQFYADDVVTQEGSEAPVFGKQAAITRLKQFQETLGVAAFVSYEVGEITVSGNTSFYDVVLSLTLSNGQTIHLEQVVKTEWREGLVVKERYYHS